MLSTGCGPIVTGACELFALQQIAMRLGIDYGVRLLGLGWGLNDAIPDRGHAVSMSHAVNSRSNHRRHMLVVRGPGRGRAGH